MVVGKDLDDTVETRLIHLLKTINSNSNSNFDFNSISNISILNYCYYRWLLLLLLDIKPLSNTYKQTHPSPPLPPPPSTICSSFITSTLHPGFQSLCCTQNSVEIEIYEKLCVWTQCFQCYPCCSFPWEKIHEFMKMICINFYVVSLFMFYYYCYYCYYHLINFFFVFFYYYHFLIFFLFFSFFPFSLFFFSYISMLHLPLSWKCYCF